MIINEVLYLMMAKVGKSNAPDKALFHTFFHSLQTEENQKQLLPIQIGELIQTIQWNVTFLYKIPVLRSELITFRKIIKTAKINRDEIKYKYK